MIFEINSPGRAYRRSNNKSFPHRYLKVKSKKCIHAFNLLNQIWKKSLTLREGTPLGQYFQYNILRNNSSQYHDFF